MDTHFTIKKISSVILNKKQFILLNQQNFQNQLLLLKKVKLFLIKNVKINWCKIKNEIFLDGYYLIIIGVNFLIKRIFQNTSNKVYSSLLTTIKKIMKFFIICNCCCPSAGICFATFSITIIQPLFVTIGICNLGSGSLCQLKLI